MNDDIRILCESLAAAAKTMEPTEDEKRIIALEAELAAARCAAAAWKQAAKHKRDGLIAILHDYSFVMRNRSRNRLNQRKMKARA